MRRFFSILATVVALALVTIGTSARAMPAADAAAPAAVATADASGCDGCDAGEASEAICPVSTCTPTCMGVAVLSAAAVIPAPELPPLAKAGAGLLVAGSAAPPDPFPPRDDV